MCKNISLEYDFKTIFKNTFIKIKVIMDVNNKNGMWWPLNLLTDYPRWSYKTRQRGHTYFVQLSSAIKTAQNQDQSCY